jgi:hypothetical protein
MWGLGSLFCCDFKTFGCQVVRAGRLGVGLGVTNWAGGSAGADPPRNLWSHEAVTGGGWLGIGVEETVAWSVPNGGGVHADA